MLENGSIGSEQGYLALKPDGQFAIEDLPDFSKFQSGPIVPRQRGSGTWRTKIDRMSDRSYLWLEFHEVSGNPAEQKYAAAYFSLEGEEYYLYVTIGDPDSGDLFVLQKAGEACERPASEEDDSRD